MKLYHASKHKFDVIKRNQATVTEGIKVPKSELQNKIYLTHNIGFAIAMASGPDGLTSLFEGQISFENYANFEQNRKVYVYEVDSDAIPKELLEQVDPDQFAVDLDELVPTDIKIYKAEDVFKYYDWTEWKGVSEMGSGYN